ncbi:hypothetical protein NQ315_000743 [Exocentrus adspersus]|uniref:Cationic amino acid transporter n=1 Tax=Exocentrus adspersus TaxID=1586481 RepID=A0AAV8WDE3_9CUCU|nr:hypothetical protein NQ315_000743 [Exocentrus adspersus]
MGNLQDFTQALTHWSFGVAILIGLVSSEFSGAETVAAVFLAGFSSTISALCGSVSNGSDEQFRRKRLSNTLYFLILWLDILTNLVAAATCARLASATVDYISKGHFREFLFGLEQHSLGEPWPDVLGVTIIVVVTLLFMLGLEKSSTISSLLFIALLCNFAFFTTIGSFHTVTKFWKWCESFRIHSYRKIIRAAAICTYAFVHNIPKTEKNHCLKMFTMVFNPLIFYTVTAIIFSLMTHNRELMGTAIPLVQVFENRDVDWARPIIAAFTITVVCLVLTDVLPAVFSSFMKLASKEWRVFVPSILYQNKLTGAPILAIFAAGSLAAILAFACPLSHLIKLLNTSSMVKCVTISCQLIFNRYKPEINYDYLVYNTNIHYSKLNNSSVKTTIQSKSQLIKEKIKSIFTSKPHYIHRLSSPNNMCQKLTNVTENRVEEREYLLLDDYSNKSLKIDLAEDTSSENDENDIVFCSDGEDSGSSTDIDIIVEEYREGLKVATVGKFNERRPSTKFTSIIAVTCLVTVITSSIVLSLYVLKVVNTVWPSIVGLFVPVIILTAMPQNTVDKSKETVIPSIIFPSCHAVSIVLNMVLCSTIIMDIWQGLLFWSVAGLLLFWRCDCCTCEGLFRSNKISAAASNDDPVLNQKECDYGDTIFITR